MHENQYEFQISCVGRLKLRPTILESASYHQGRLSLHRRGEHTLFLFGTFASFQTKTNQTGQSRIYLPIRQRQWLNWLHHRHARELRYQVLESGLPTS